MKSRYSRLASVEEKRNIRRALIFGILTIGAVIFLFTAGLGVLTKFVGVISDLRKTTAPIDKYDTTPPPPPFIDVLPEATNNAKLQVTGSAEPGSNITLTVEDQKSESLAGNDGSFSFNIVLSLGKNEIYASAKDAAGNESQKSQTYEIVYSKEPPDLAIESPNDGAQFFGSKNQEVKVSGKTAVGVSLTMNDRFVAVEDDGSFSASFNLGEGQNSIRLKAVDKAGNTSEKSLTVSYSP